MVTFMTNMMIMITVIIIMTMMMINMRILIIESSLSLRLKSKGPATLGDDSSGFSWNSLPSLQVAPPHFDSDFWYGHPSKSEQGSPPLTDKASRWVFPAFPNHQPSPGQSKPDRESWSRCRCTFCRIRQVPSWRGGRGWTMMGFLKFLNYFCCYDGLLLLEFYFLCSSYQIHITQGWGWWSPWWWSCCRCCCVGGSGSWKGGRGRTGDISPPWSF